MNKFCKSCIYFLAPAKGLDTTEYAKCVYGMGLSLVTGIYDRPTQSSAYCISVRTSDKPQDCGPAAQFYEGQPFTVAALSTVRAS